MFFLVSRLLQAQPYSEWKASNQILQSQCKIHHTLSYVVLVHMLTMSTVVVPNYYSAFFAQKNHGNDCAHTHYATHKFAELHPKICRFNLVY